MLLKYLLALLGRRNRGSANPSSTPVHDPLTGIYNRAGVLQIAQGLFANAEIQRGVCVMLMDIDHFKKINDAHGLEAGDGVIKAMAQLLGHVVRNGDFIGRWSGEEFILLCANSTPQGARRLAEKIRSAVACEEFQVGSGRLEVTVSVGIALAAAGESFEAVLKRANTALHEAKQKGRNRTVLAWSAGPVAVKAGEPRQQ